ncbi:MAG TPA: hypothetical protein VKV27_16295 [Solirubrobacteraceae bacterium]|nr:hypothetical protein [Solirubrobacteraceae bacterium]
MTRPARTAAPPPRTAAPPPQTAAPPPQTTAPPPQTTAPPPRTTAPPPRTTALPLRAALERRWRRAAATALGLACLALVAPGPALGARAGTHGAPGTGTLWAGEARAGTMRPPVPQGFVGVDVDGPILNPATGIDLQAQMRAMVASGVQSIRAAFSWSQAQPYESWSQVPPAVRSQFTDVDGRPFYFQVTDEIVAAAARARISVLPTVLYAPSWDAVPNPDGVSYPRAFGPYAAYLTALIDRYGPRGSFWRAHPGLPRMPIRAWQVWNEENLTYYWRQPFAPTYARLLAAARAAIRRADPGARLVLGALTNAAWRALGELYRVRGARRLFDVVAVNGFTRLPANVIVYLRLMRRAMDRFGDFAKPLLATEVSWPSAAGQVTGGFDFDTTEAGQARNIAALLPALGADRRALGLAGFYWYTWVGQEPGPLPFDYAGLERFTAGRVVAKPALRAFAKAALALEGCRRKGAVATACIR